MKNPLKQFSNMQLFIWKISLELKMRSELGSKNNQVVQIILLHWEKVSLYDCCWFSSFFFLNCI